MPADQALDVIYSLIIDEVAPGPETPRYKVRQKLDEALNRPFDPDQARQYDIELWAKQNEAFASEQDFDLTSDFAQAP